ncbi:MAG: rRNA pseudouridine synthase [Desulfovibrionaceae bacterium]|nr:rRNA pseudouridine synthase [Desulfovibrionaceae bacterium]
MTERKNTPNAGQSNAQTSPEPSGRLRLNKALAQAGVCSRRAADELILAGRIAVNGVTVATPGVSVDPIADAISLDGRPVAAPAKTAHTVLMLHKPPMVVTTAKDPQKRQTVLDLLPDKYNAARLFPVGRLDYFSEGLLLITDDGDLAYRLTHPKWHLTKTYRVLVRGELTPDTLDRMRNGMALAEGDTVAPIGLKADAPRPDGAAWLTMALTQGLNRQIRRMCRDLELTVLRIVRTAQGPIELGRLPKGACRELAAPELAALRAAVGLERERERKRNRGETPFL